MEPNWREYRTSSSLWGRGVAVAATLVMTVLTLFWIGLLPGW